MTNTDELNHGQRLVECHVKVDELLDEVRAFRAEFADFVEESRREWAKIRGEQ